MNDDWQGEYEYFRESEMECQCGCGGLPCDSFMVKLELLRKELNFPLAVSSGYRCPSYNEVVAGSGTDGPHTRGIAADFLIWGEHALDLITIAVARGFTGIGVKQRGKPSERFIHLDYVENSSSHPRPWIWSY